MNGQHSLAALLMQADYYDRLAARLARDGHADEAEEVRRDAMAAWHDVAEAARIAQR